MLLARGSAMPQPIPPAAGPPPALSLPVLPLPPLALPSCPPGPLAAEGGPALPLRGLTLLAVEDSRFACEALRLICQRTGARLRRAETLAAARAHLRTYRPDIAVVDLGLPDGSGLSLIADLALSVHRPEAVVAISGEALAREAAFDAGADAFVEKPLDSVSAFLALLNRLLPGRVPALPPAAAPARDGAAVRADPLALQDDLGRAAALLAQGGPGGYVAGFVRGLAGQMQDSRLAEAARQARMGQPAQIAALQGMIAGLLAPQAPGAFAPRRSG
jgi:CheY-like chemotaxis protein